jgi:hypothetical protein
MYVRVYSVFVVLCDRLCGLTTDPEVRVRFPALPDFLSSGSNTKGDDVRGQLRNS